MKKTILFSLATASLLLASEQDKGYDTHGIAVNLTADFSYVNRSQDLHAIEAPGFFHADEGDGHDHGRSVTSKGFNFNSAELEVEAPIGRNFEVFSTFHLTEDSFEVEELYGKTVNKDGFNIKAGKFYSSFGYSNSKHPESLDFTSKPMIQDFVFGDHGLNEKGIGVTWNNKNLIVGLEVLQGENERSFGTGEIEYTGATSGEIEVQGNDGADLMVTYLKGNTRIGTTLLNAGLSLAKGKTRIDHTADENLPHAIESDTTITGFEAGFTIPFTRTSNLALNSEYIKREFDGTSYVDNAGIVASAAHTRNQSGVYVDAVYTIDSQWKVGVSFDKILDNKINGIDKDIDFKKTSAMAEYQLNKNNKFRLQYDKDESKFTDTDGLLSYNQVTLQWQFNFGTGAHNH